MASLSEEERSNIAAMLNFDMVGSPNFVRFVYDGDLSDSPPPPSGAPASFSADRGAVPGLLRGPGPGDVADCVRRPLRLRAVSSRSASPRAACSPAPKGSNRQQAAIFGGTVGEQYDPCYHLSCDTTNNLSLTALDQMSDAAAHATISLAQSAQAINGQRGKGNFNLKKPVPAAPMNSLIGS